MHATFCVLHHFSLFLYSQNTNVFFLCFWDIHACTWIKCDNTIMYSIFEHRIKNVIYITNCFGTEIFIRHILKQMFNQNRCEICYPIFPYLLFNITTVKIIISHLCAFFYAPLFMGIKPYIKPRIKSNIISFSLYSMLNLIPQIFHFLHKFFQIGIIFCIRFSFVIKPSSINATFSLHDSRRQCISL